MAPLKAWKGKKYITQIIPTSHYRAIRFRGGELGQQAKLKVTVKPFTYCNSVSKRQRSTSSECSIFFLCNSPGWGSRRCRTDGGNCLLPFYGSMGRRGLEVREEDQGVEWYWAKVEKVSQQQSSLLSMTAQGSLDSKPSRKLQCTGCGNGSFFLWGLPGKVL